MRRPSKPILRPKIAGQWSAFGDWVDHASRDIGEHMCPLDGTGQPQRAVCVDSKGRRCTVGADFKRADKEGAFPVYYFWDCTT